MVDEENSLETLLAKATNPLHRQVDPDAIAAFCDQVEKELDGPQVALRLLAHKIQSPQEREAILALSVLEESMKLCGSKFRSEVGKFRFLNEMIKVVSPKYLGTRASPKVKQKIIELMFKWSMELKQEVKIFEAYQMLKRQGVVLEDPVNALENYEPPPPPPPRPKSAVFEDDEKAQLLQKLLHSRNPEDLQAANRLIKNMVREADRRMELLAKRTTELETVHNNAKVLADMLGHYRAGETSQEEKELMKELFQSCERLRPKLFKLAGEMDEKDDGLCDILKANDELTAVINQYKKVMGLGNTTHEIINDNGKGEASLLDLGSPPQSSLQADTSLLDDQLLALGLSDTPTTIAAQGPISSHAISTSCSTKTQDSLEELGQIFSSASATPPSVFMPTQSTQPFPIVKSVSNVPINSVSTISGTGQPTSSLSASGSKGTTTPNFTVSLQPLVASKPVTTPAPSGMHPSQSQGKVSPAPPSRGLEELDELGQTLLKQSLPPSTVPKVDFPGTPQKIPMSQLQKQQTSAPGSPSLLRPVSAPGDVKNSVDNTSLNSLPSESTSPSKSPVHDALTLSDLFVPLETIQPGTLPPLTLHEKNGLVVVVHFGRDSPRPDVTVMVVSTMSKNTSPVKNVSFQAAVPKMMKIKLQPLSATDLPPHNPILPPAAITQVMLLANPLKEKVRLKYKVTYTINDEVHVDTGDVDNLLGPR